MQLRFPTAGARSEFIARLNQDEPSLMEAIKPSYSQPTIMTVRPGELVRRRVEALLKTDLGAEVKIYEDVQFSLL